MTRWRKRIGSDRMKLLKAFVFIKKRMTVVQRSKEDRALWRTDYPAVRTSLVEEGVFEKSLADQLEALGAM